MKLSQNKRGIIKLSITFIIFCLAITMIVTSAIYIEHNESIISKLAGENLVDQKNTYTYSNHHFYGELLNLSIEEQVKIKTYQLTNNHQEVVMDEKYDSNLGIMFNLSLLDEGEYQIHINHKPIYATPKQLEAVETVWYTVMRHGYANKVTVETHRNQLTLTVEKVDQLPEGVYDILIDAGHGGLDTGAVSNRLIEAEEVLIISKYIASRLEEYGLKVKLTREDEFDPAGEDNYNYKESPYYKNGRVEQIYQHQGKYLISNHLNALDTTFSGFEIYSSIFASNAWSDLISKELLKTGHLARDSVNNEFRVSKGSYKKHFTGEHGNLDYYYIIRETGGPATDASRLPLYNPNYIQVPNYGAESILIEYVYMDNEADEQFWIDNWQTLAEAVIKATLEYLGIND